MSLYDRIADSQPTQGGVYFLPGNYIAQLDVMKMIRTRNDDDMFVSEWDILESSNEDRSAGSHCSFLQNFSGNQKEVAPGNVKACIAAASGVDLDEIDSDGVEVALSEKNPLRGRLVRVEVVASTSKKGREYHRHRFFSIPDEMQDKADALREQAGLPPF